jgi:hypothetical protein
MVRASLPAISDIEVRTGAFSRSSSITSPPMAVTPRPMSAAKSSGRAAGNPQNATTAWPGTSDSYSAGSGPFNPTTSSLRPNTSPRLYTVVAPAPSKSASENPASTPASFWTNTRAPACVRAFTPDGASATRCSRARISFGMPISIALSPVRDSRPPGAPVKPVARIPGPIPNHSSLFTA